MSKCKGHTHILDEEGNQEIDDNGNAVVKLCDEEMKRAGFAKDRGIELYICENEGCSNKGDVKEVPITDI